MEDPRTGSLTWTRQRAAASGRWLKKSWCGAKPEHAQAPPSRSDAFSDVRLQDLTCPVELICSLSLINLLHWRAPWQWDITQSVVFLRVSDAVCASRVSLCLSLTFTCYAVGFGFLRSSIGLRVGFLTCLARSAGAN